jgi:hypothetical protein
MRWLASVCLFLLGCGARSELDVTPMGEDASVMHETHHDGLDAGLDVVEEPIVFLTTCNPADASPPDVLCTKTVTMGEFNQPGGCENIHYFVDSGAVGELEYACDGGTPWAAVVFDGQTFPGTLQNDLVDVCISSTFPFQDGVDCASSKSIWQTAQRIYGDYTSGTLTFTYSNKVIEGHSCWMPCDSWADVTVQ